MRIDETVHDGVGILSINGNLAMDEVAELKKLITPYLEEQKFSGLIWNMEGVSHIDSSGVGLIAHCYKALKRSNIKFALAALNQNNREMLNISKLDKFLIIAKNNESALKILKD